MDRFAKTTKWPTDSHYAFSGQAGYLDHALASSSMARRVTDASIWHINADEPGVLDCNTECKAAGQVVSLYTASSDSLYHVWAGCAIMIESGYSLPCIDEEQVGVAWRSRSPY